MPDPSRAAKSDTWHGRSVGERRGEIWAVQLARAQDFIDRLLRGGDPSLLDWYDRVDVDDCAPDSHVHHLKHAMACIGMIVDVLGTTMLNDNRPPQISMAQPGDKARSAEVALAV